MRTITTLLTLLFCTPLLAENPSIIITDNGYFLLILKDGVPEVQTPFKVIDTREGDTPPSSPGNPGVSPDPELTKKVKAWAVEVSDTDSAQGLALIYRHTEESLRAGTLNVNTAIETQREATDKYLEKQEKSEEWKFFRDNLSNELSTRMARGNITPKTLGEFFIATAFGLELAADGSEALSMTALLEIVSITNTIIDSK